MISPALDASYEACCGAVEWRTVYDWTAHYEIAAAGVGALRGRGCPRCGACACASPQGPGRAGAWAGAARNESGADGRAIGGGLARTRPVYPGAVVRSHRAEPRLHRRAPAPQPAGIPRGGEHLPRRDLGCGGGLTMRFAAKVDANQPAMFTQLRAAGLHVVDTSRLGHGFPDICGLLRNYGTITPVPELYTDAAAVLVTPRGVATERELLMQPHNTLTPFFPENLDDYAPWVAKHGLLAPYGKCQCGCGGSP